MDGTRSEAFIIVNIDKRLTLIGGTSYAGEIKKSMFSVMNYFLPKRGVLTMHASANEGEDGDVTLFFGLSGTGKTTLSSDPERGLIGDDEHGWSEDGVFNVEGGCYAKMIRLSAEAEPQIYSTTRRFGTVLENVKMDANTRVLDLDELRERLRPHFLGRGVGRDQVGVLGLDRPELVQERVVLVVADLWRVPLVVEPVVVVETLAERILGRTVMHDLEHPETGEKLAEAGAQMGEQQRARQQAEKRADHEGADADPTRRRDADHDGVGENRHQVQHEQVADRVLAEPLGVALDGRAGAAPDGGALPPGRVGPTAAAGRQPLQAGDRPQPPGQPIAGVPPQVGDHVHVTADPTQQPAGPGQRRPRRGDRRPVRRARHGGAPADRCRQVALLPGAGAGGEPARARHHGGGVAAHRPHAGPGGRAARARRRARRMGEAGGAQRRSRERGGRQQWGTGLARTREGETAPAPKPKAPPPAPRGATAAGGAPVPAPGG